MACAFPSVVHTHRHRDHYAGDVQFSAASDVQIIAPDLASVRAFFGFDAGLSVWRTWTWRSYHRCHPSAGHETAHIVFYDERTALLSQAISLLPGG